MPTSRTDNGDLNLYANEKASAGVVDAYRDAGAAAITMGSGVSIDAGTGAVSIRLDDGAGNTNHTAGDMTLGSITAGSIFAQTTAAGSDITLGSGALLTASGTGNALTLAAAGDFLNSSGSSSPFDLTGGGRWLIYSTNPASNTPGGLTARLQSLQLQLQQPRCLRLQRHARRHHHHASHRQRAALQLHADRHRNTG